MVTPAVMNSVVSDVINCFYMYDNKRLIDGIKLVLASRETPREKFEQVAVLIVRLRGEAPVAERVARLIMVQTGHREIISWSVSNWAHRTSGTV